MNFNTKIDSKKFGAKLRMLRLKKELRQTDVGEAIESTGNSVARWERGTVMPTLDMSYRLAQLFEVSLEELISGTFVS